MMKPSKPLLRRCLTTLLILATLAVFGIIGLGYYLAGPADSIPRMIENPSPDGILGPVAASGELVLKVMTLNLAHGRGSGTLQIMTAKKQTLANLSAVAAMIKRVTPHVVGLQEADWTSFFSGGFSHVEHLLQLTGMKVALAGEHVGMQGLSYGTGFLSLQPVIHMKSRTFEPTPPTLTKGFVAVTVNWPGSESVEVELVSVHLDFLLASNRRQQARVLLDYLSDRKNPLVIMGDFNADWQEADSVVKTLTHALKLKAYRPESKHTPTFPATGKRIDWILISSELAFVSYTVQPDIVSDHLAVAAEIRLIK